MINIHMIMYYTFILIKIQYHNNKIIRLKIIVKIEFYCKNYSAKHNLKLLIHTFKCWYINISNTQTYQTYR